MVDTIRLLSDESAEATLRLTADKYIAGEAALIEHAAQSCAAMLGERFHESRIGYLGEIKGFRFYELAQPGDLLLTRIDILAELDHMFLVSARTTRGTQVLAEGKMKLFVG